jgi:hypothetical protein
MENVKIGDVVAWAEVPSGALVRTHGGDFALRVGDDGHWVRLVGEIKMDWARAGAWGGWSFDEGEVVDEGASAIVALGLTGQETAADLQRLAEVFEVREALLSINDLEAVSGRYLESAGEFNVAFDMLATDLHAAGWRPGMTAEDAARMLAEVS